MSLPYDYARCSGFDDDRNAGCPTRGRCKRWTNRKDRGPQTLVYDWMCETSDYEHRIPVEGTEEHAGPGPCPNRIGETK
jgi:hypothetical protein